MIFKNKAQELVHSVNKKVQQGLDSHDSFDLKSIVIRKITKRPVPRCYKCGNRDRRKMEFVPSEEAYLCKSCDDSTIYDVYSGHDYLWACQEWRKLKNKKLIETDK